MTIGDSCEPLLSFDSHERHDETPPRTGPSPRPDRLPRSVARLLLDTTGPTSSRFAASSVDSIAYAVLIPLARCDWSRARALAVLQGTWPSPSAQRLAARFARVDDPDRARWLDALWSRAVRLASPTPAPATVSRLAETWRRGVLAPWPGPAGDVDRSVWLALAGAAWQLGTHQVRVGAGEITELTGVPTRSVWRALRRLERAGRFVVTVHSSGGHHPNRYRTIAPSVPSSGQPDGSPSICVSPASLLERRSCGAPPTAHDVETVASSVPIGPAASNGPSVRPDDPSLGHPLHTGWHPVALGLGAHAVATQLIAADGEPITIRRLAARMGRTPDTTLASVRGAMALGLAERTPRGVAAGPVLLDGGRLLELLDGAAETSGARAAAADHREFRLARATERAAWRPGHRAAVPGAMP
jgi:hypothetical protein